MEEQINELSIVPITDDDYVAPLNGAKHISFPIELLIAYKEKEFNKPEFFMLTYIMSKYGWQQAIAPAITNKELCEFLGAKDSSVRSMLSRLKKARYINTFRSGKDRIISIPLYGKMLEKHYQKRNKQNLI